MPTNQKCRCHICKVERHLALSLSEPPVRERFLKLGEGSPSLANFVSVTALIDDLHDQSDRRSQSPSAAEILGALIQIGRSVANSELS
ncbi:MAG: hypothetical protein ACREBQ_13195, partial [Nitrososphaerales archaeon]